MSNLENDQKDKIKELGKYIKKLREAHGYSFQKLAELSGLSMGMVNQLENGTARSMPKGSSLTTLAKALGVPELELHRRAGYLLEESTDKLIKTNKGSFVAVPRNVESEDWKCYYTSSLANMGFKQKYINEIIQYIQTVQIKQEIEEGNIKDTPFKLL